ncbi:MAG TPA: hypothetical protein VK171_13785 [Fimbriimonas sp.]|nr:hypothetical protein [Fimbriimonas sp.]
MSQTKGTEAMTQIRENIWQVTYDDLGHPPARGYYQVEGLGEVLIDQADLHYINETHAKGYEPVFHVSRSKALNNAFVVVGRQQKA